ncbi:hypothetical protein ACSQ67_019670 [Phaseolus vulgaris]
MKREEEARGSQLGALDSQAEVEKESKASKWQNPYRESKQNSIKEGKLKVSTELGNQKTYTRRSVRLSERTPNSKRDMKNERRFVFNIQFDGDTNQRKARECNNVIREEPENLWSIGERIGLAMSWGRR